MAQFEVATREAERNPPPKVDFLASVLNFTDLAFGIGFFLGDKHFGVVRVGISFGVAD